MDNILRDISLVWLLIHCIVMFLLLFESRLSTKKTFIISALFLIIEIPLNIIGVYIFGTKIAAMLIPITCVLPSLILFVWMAKKRDLRFVFTFCFADTIVLWILVFTYFLNILFNAGGNIVMLISRIVLVLLAEIIIYRFVRKTYQELQSKITRGWGIFSATGALFYMALLFYAFTPDLITTDYKVSFPLFFILAILPVMYITIFILIKSQIDMASEKERNELLSMQIQMAQQRITASMHIEEATRILRHDLRHHIVLIYSYIENGENEKAKEYINTISSQIDRSSKKNFCQNSTLNLVLCFYYGLAEKAGIGIDADVRLSNDLSIPEQDLIVIFSNAIENAVNHLSDTKTSGTVSIHALGKKI